MLLRQSSIFNAYIFNGKNICKNKSQHSNSHQQLIFFLEEMQGHRTPKEITLLGRLDLSGLVERKEGCKC